MFLFSGFIWAGIFYKCLNDSCEYETGAFLSNSDCLLVTDLAI